MTTAPARERMGGKNHASAIHPMMTRVPTPHQYQNGDTENVADTNSAKLCQMRSIYPPFPTGVVVTQRRMMLRMLVPSMIHAAVSAEKITPQPPKPAR